jgi:hypothetical protein
MCGEATRDALRGYLETAQDCGWDTSRLICARSYTWYNGKDRNVAVCLSVCAYIQVQRYKQVLKCVYFHKCMCTFTVYFIYLVNFLFSNLYSIEVLNPISYGNFFSGIWRFFLLKIKNKLWSKVLLRSIIWTLSIIYVFLLRFEGWLFPRHQVNLLCWVRSIELASIDKTKK